MEQIEAFTGALVMTYGVSRLMLRILAPYLSRIIYLLAAHASSLMLLMLVVGFWKSYFTFFAFAQTTVFIIPQLLWFIMDKLRGKDEMRPAGRSDYAGRR